MYLCISWSRTRKEKPVDYQDVRGEFRHVPPTITKTNPSNRGVFVYLHFRSYLVGCLGRCLNLILLFYRWHRVKNFYRNVAESKKIMYFCIV